MSVRDEQLIRPVWPFALNHGSQQARGLVAWWPMVHGGGNTLHGLDGRCRSMTLFNSPVWGADRDGNPALSFNGSNSYAFNNSFSFDTGSDYAFSTWWSTAALPAINAGIVELVEGSFARYTLIRHTSSGAVTGIAQGLGGTNASINSASTYGIDIWRHALLTRFQGILYLYINGRQDASAAVSGTTNISGANLYFARTHDGRYLNAKVRDVRFYHRGFSAAEAWAMYDPASRYELYYPLGRRLWFIPAGTLVTPLSVSGSITPVSTLIKQGNKALSGSASPAGTITKQANKGASGSIAPSGSIAGLFAHALAGLITPTGALAKLAGKLVAGMLTPSGALGTLKVTLLSLAGSLGLSGVLTRRASKGLSGTITAAGGLAKRLAKALSSAITAVGALVSSLSGTNERITVTLSDEAVTIASVSDDLGG